MGGKEVWGASDRPGEAKGAEKAGSGGGGAVPWDVSTSARRSCREWAVLGGNASDPRVGAPAGGSPEGCR